MEKQYKTFGSLTILDKVYKPMIEDIIFYSIESIAKDGLSQDIIIHFDGNDYLKAQSSNTVINSRYKKNICVNRAKAVEIQQEMRKQKLMDLQKKVQEAIDKLNEFSSKYFKINL